jgi:hypothetical protein
LPGLDRKPHLAVTEESSRQQMRNEDGGAEHDAHQGHVGVADVRLDRDGADDHQADCDQKEVPEQGPVHQGCDHERHGQRGVAGHRQAQAEQKHRRGHQQHRREQSQRRQESRRPRSRWDRRAGVVFHGASLADLATGVNPGPGLTLTLRQELLWFVSGSRPAFRRLPRP